LPSDGLSSPVCRAYFKLREAAFYLDLNLNSHSIALDVGASPGGWSSYLAESGCTQVFSVDPGLLDARVLAMPTVEHLRMKIEDALPLLTRRGLAGRIGFYCCDMNAPPAQAVDFLLKALPLLRPGAAVVITFKNTLHNPRAKKAEWEADVAAGVQAMGAAVEGVRVVQLFANTPRECTVLGRVVGGEGGERRGTDPSGAGN
jgi:predicted rRNA methylase YqxC with S4 and FtsJ domains